MNAEATRTGTGCSHGVRGHATVREYAICNVANAPEPTPEQAATINRILWSGWQSSGFKAPALTAAQAGPQGTRRRARQKETDR